MQSCKMFKHIEVQRMEFYLHSPKMHRLIKSKEEQKQAYAETRERETKKKKQNQNTNPRTR